MAIYGLTVAIGAFIAGLGLGAIFNTAAYHKGFEDGSDETYEAFKEEHEKLRREYYETITDSIHDALDY